ncbi:MAG: prepilin peptidase [Planctomycetota bacterium]|nr:MAG: prepilin peptidase [Planctomycetota bacterium]
MTHTILAFAGSAPVKVIPAWIWLLLIAAGVVASVTDLRSTRIPNWLTLPLLAGGLLYASAQGGLPAVGQAGAGVVAAGLPLVIAYILFGGGAGDAKLMIAFGSWLGGDASIILTLGVAVTGFLQSMTVIISRHGLRDVPITILHSLGMVQFAAAQAVRGKFIGPVEDEGIVPNAPNRVSRPRPKGWIPFAPAILAGTILAWWYWEHRGALR